MRGDSCTVIRRAGVPDFELGDPNKPCDEVARGVEGLDRGDENKDHGSDDIEREREERGVSGGCIAEDDKEGRLGRAVCSSRGVCRERRGGDWKRSARLQGGPWT